MNRNCFIILNYNDCETVIKLLHQICGYKSIEHILVVDNCSTDDSFTQLKKNESTKITVIQTNQNRGYAYGNNYGAEYAIDKWQPQILFFANPDVEFKEDTIGILEKTLYLESDYAVAAPLVQNGYNVWKIPGYWGCLRSLFLIMFSIHKYHIKKYLKNNKGIHEVGVVEGSFFAIKTSAFVEINGFDERTFLYLEENILSKRLQEQNYKVVVNSEAVYVHAHSNSIRKEYKTKTNAFRLFEPSYRVYLENYLHCRPSEMMVFRFFFILAFLERKIYDLLGRRIEKWKGRRR